MCRWHRSTSVNPAAWNIAMVPVKTADAEGLICSSRKCTPRSTARDEVSQRAEQDRAEDQGEQKQQAG